MNKKILLADANADYRALLLHYLQILGYPMSIEAGDGEEAVSKALAERPDLIIMEVLLPKKDGFQAVAELRTHPLTQHTFFLAATVLVLPQDRKKCLAKGFHAYLPKPFTLWQLKDILQTIFSTDAY